jgi:hypothetical protein
MAKMAVKKMKHWEDEIEREIERIDAGGNAWDDTDEVVEIEVKAPLDKVVPVRLTSDKWAALRREATELGIGPTTLARMWILEKLRSVTAERAAPKPAPKRRKSA